MEQQEKTNFHICLRRRANIRHNSALYEKGVHGKGYCAFCGEEVFFIKELREKMKDKRIVCTICLLQNFVSLFI